MAIQLIDAQGNITTDISKAVTKQLRNPGLSVDTNLPGEGELFFFGGQLGVRQGGGIVDLAAAEGKNVDIGSALATLGLNKEDIPQFSLDILAGNVEGGGLSLLGGQSAEFFKKFLPTTVTPGVSRTEDPAAIAASLDPNSPENVQARADAAARLGQPDIPVSDTVSAPAPNGQNPFFGIPSKFSGQLTSSEQAQAFQDALLAGQTNEQALATALGTDALAAPETPISTEGLIKISSPEKLAEIAKSLGITPENESQFLIRDGVDIYLKPEALQAFVDPDFRGGVTGQARGAQAGELPDGTPAVPPPDISNILDTPEAPGAEPSAPGEEPKSPFQSLLGKYGINALGTGDNPPVSFADAYKQLVNDLGLPTIKDAFNEVQTQFNDLQDELNEAIFDVNDNPWLTEGTRVLRIRKIEEKFEGKLGNLTNQMKLYNSLYEQGLVEARFVAGASQNQAQFDITTQINLLRLAQDEAQALADLDSQITVKDGRRVLLNLDTGEVIADLGPAPSETDFELEFDEQGNPFIFDPSSGILSPAIGVGGNRAQRNNNPLNIKIGGATQYLVDQGIATIEQKPAQDGGNFLVFDNPQDGFTAAGILLKSSVYNGLKINEAMMKWSGGGYGADVAPAIDQNKTVGELSNEELANLVQGMATREGFFADTGFQTQAGDISTEKGLLQSKIKALPAGQQEGAFAAISSFKNANDIINLLNLGVETGPIQGRAIAGVSIFGKVIIPGRQQLGTSTANEDKLVAAMIAFSANFIKSISGVAVSAQEFERLMLALPGINRQETVNRNSLESLLNTIQNKYETQLGINFDDFPNEIPQIESFEEQINQLSPEQKQELSNEGLI